MAIPKTVLIRVLLIITLLSAAAMLFVPPIVQDSRYHQFADQRTILGIPNFYNVITNLAFLWVGFMAVYKLYKAQLKIMAAVQQSYTIFFIAIACIAFGSAYYHWQPNNSSLVWDRVPITIAFMSLFSFTLAETVSCRLGRMVLFPLLFTGILSVACWYWGEIHGSGDLRLYALVQFLPLLLLLLLLLLGQPVFNSQAGYWYLLTAYVLAKLAEHFDVTIFQLTSGMVGGHALKHLLSAAGLYVLLVFFEKRSSKNVFISSIQHQQK